MIIHQNNRKLIYLFACTLLVLWSCGSDSAGSGVEHPDDYVEEAYMDMDYNHVDKKQPVSGDEQSNQPLPDERMLIRRGNMSIEVKNLAEAEQGIRALVSDAGGYVSRESSFSSTHRRERSFELRLPANSFDATIEQIEHLAIEVDHRNISTEDVTEEYIDVQTRLKTKKALEQRYMEILAHAKSVEDILRVESELEQVRAQIESMEGRLKYLKNQTSYSTLELNIYTQYAPEFAGRLAKALNNGWKLLKDFVVAVFTLWPFILLVILLIWGVRRIKKRRSRTGV